MSELPAPTPRPPRRRLAVLFALLAACGVEQRFAALGDFPTEGGKVVEGCQLGYRVYGRLDPDRSNAVLLLPWFQGTSAELAGLVGPGKLLDTARYAVVAVDALGNGVSTSPSNSASQPGDAFPALTIGDMVESERALVTRELGIQRLRAVVGISMGGMQALAWAARHPALAGDVVVVAGSPRSTERDRAYWRQADLEARRPVWRRVATAAGRGDRHGVAWVLRVDPRDHAAQASAIARLDLAAPLGGLAGLAAALRGRLFLAVPERDEVVDPGPVLELARLAGAEVVRLDGRCGHAAPTCEAERLGAEVRRFLGSSRP